MICKFPRLIVAALILCTLAWAVQAQDDAVAPARSHTAGEPSKEPAKLPADQTTHHVLELPGRTLQFAATARASSSPARS